ncbi:hypothetical protein [Aliikangiella coralliicola]|uniref:Uncharacterized protein n=1 Tax=Aliikangiella coralliicola TaxID=2592383 RepID=A0A545UCX3_9GAMM|nr:hypothetical protein [Aliikangiella coralliicola]TQV87312.1 hypothetical protein FLL46_12750 [Aliikangiella coralliicola]
MFLKKILLVTSFSLFTISNVAVADSRSSAGDNLSGAEQKITSADGELKFSGYLNLTCASPETCGTYSSGWHKAKVYSKFTPGIPPSLEMRIYWKKNVPAGIAAGRHVAKAIGDGCPDGSNMTATWLLDSNGTPIYAVSKDCNGLRHEFNVSQLP